MLTLYKISNTGKICHVLNGKILAGFQKIRTDDFLCFTASGDGWGVDELYYGASLLIRGIFFWVRWAGESFGQFKKNFMDLSGPILFPSPAHHLQK
jgi:hypothetical protein